MGGVKKYLNWFFFLVLLLQVHHSIGQTTPVTETQVRALLAQRGIPEDTLKARLIKKGFDPDNVRVDQFEEFQSAVLITIEEIENEARVKASIPPIADPTDLPPRTEPAKPIVTQQSAQPDTQPSLRVKAPIYGQEIFRNNSIPVYQQTENINVPDSYILDIGDQIGVLGFGRSQFEEVMSIRASGFVQPKDRLPQILLKGVRWGDAKEILFQRYSQYHLISRSEFIATLVKPRNLTVNVFGEAKTTGAITLPGINTAINVISAAGGPTDIGSVRSIKVIRGGTTIPLDIYAFMNDPAIGDNYYLQNNDYIHIPVAEKVVTIRGEVIRPMAYELLESENLIQLIQFAGGALPKAYLSDVQITRYLDTRRIVINVDLKALMEQGGDYVLFKGDIVDIRAVEESAENFVSISGAVMFPGSYENKPGTRVSDLVRQSVLRPDARMDYAILLRYKPNGTFQYERLNLQSIAVDPASPDNVLLNNLDRIQIVTIKTYTDPGYFVVTGAVKKPNRFAINLEGDVKLEDALLLAGGPTLEAADNGYIVRHDPREPKTLEYIDINIKEAMENPLSAANVEIKSGDVLQVFTKSSRRDEQFVSVFGAVRQPGTYAYAPNMSLGDIVNLAGGFTYDADHNRIDIARIEMEAGNAERVTLRSASLPAMEYQLDDNSVELAPYDHIYVRSIPEFEFQQTVLLEGEVKYPGTYPLLQDKERIYDLIERAGGLTGRAFPEGAKLYRAMDSTGLVVIDLAHIMSNKSTPSNIVLVAGDYLIVPKSKDLVTIEGFINLDDAYSNSFLANARSISVAFRGARSAKYYIDEFAAGISHQGAPAEVKVQYADGRVEKTRKFLFFNQYPRAERGSHIIVGAKEEKPVAVKEEKKTDWGATLRDTMAQATAVLTLLILVDQLSK